MTPGTPSNGRRRRFIVLILLLLIAGAVAAFFFSGEDAPPPSEALPESSSEPVATIETLPLPPAQDIANHYGGLSANTEQQSLVTRVGNNVVTRSDAARMGGASFRFYVLADQNRINVFALPDGTIFITTLLLNHLKTEGQLAAMLAHEIGHITARHQPNWLATGVVTYTREQEILADANGVRYMSQAGYDPRAFIAVLMKLRDIHTTVPVEFFSSHPSPVNRVPRIEFAIKQQFPEGVPEALSD